MYVAKDDSLKYTEYQKKLITSSEQHSLKIHGIRGEVQ